MLMGSKSKTSQRIFILGLFALLASGGMAYFYSSSSDREPSSIEEPQTASPSASASTSTIASTGTNSEPEKEPSVQTADTMPVASASSKIPEERKAEPSEAFSSQAPLMSSRETKKPSRPRPRVSEQLTSEPQTISRSSAVEALPSSEPPRSEITPRTHALEVAGEDPMVGLRIFAGLGANYVQYDELLTDVTTKYRDFRAPSYHGGMSIDLDSTTTVEASFKATPMHFDNSSVELSALDGIWQTLGIQGATLSGNEAPDVLVDRSSTLEQQKNQLKWLWGFQFHSMPIALFDDLNNAPVMRTIQLINASLGASYDRYLNPQTKAQIFLRAQYPVVAQSTSGASNFSARPKILFDGSVGVEKKVRPGRWVGLHWYGQYQSLDFNYTDSKVTAAGTHNVFFSNIEARITFEF